MLNWEPRHVAGHHESCIINFGHNDKLCDCGATLAALDASIAALARARIAACDHQWTGFRDAKVCAKCSIPKREWKGK